MTSASFRASTSMLLGTSQLGKKCGNKLWIFFFLFTHVCVFAVLVPDLLHTVCGVFGETPVCDTKACMR